jgi:alpha-L-fucosidase
MNTMLKTFSDIKGIAHFEFIHQGQTVSQAYYMEILKRLREAVRRKRPELWTNDWILHHDNAPAHKALCQVVSGPKIDYRNGAPTLFP